MVPYELATLGSNHSSPLIPSGISIDMSDLASWANSLVPDTAMMADMWTDQIASHQAVTAINTHDVEEDWGIRLVHALLTCAEAIQCGELPLAASLVNEITNHILTHVNTTVGIGKVASYFVEALAQRLYNPGQVTGPTGLGPDYEVLYHHFYEACPYLKFAHFTANQAILEAFEGHDCVHVIDFGLTQGLQWPALIQALALRPGGPPALRLTGIIPHSGRGSDSVRESGLRLAELARSVNMQFAFRAVTASRLEDIKPWMLEPSGPKEVLAVNSVLHLHRLIGSGSGSGIDPVLKLIRSLNPKIVTVVEQEANHNQPEFLARFTEALYYYSTLLDSLEASCQPTRPERALSEIYIQREIMNIVCCEGPDRVERHEPLDRWQARMCQAGFGPMKLGPNAYRQASMLLTLFSADGYSVEEREGCLMLSWHGRALITASSWQVGPAEDGSPTSVGHNERSSSSSSSL